MRNFNDLDYEVKLSYHNQLSECAKSFGGANYFLQLMEAIRKNKQNPLVAKNREFAFALGYIKWNKVIFADKLELLIKVRFNENKDDNFIPNVGNKYYKNILNLVRALSPIIFEVKPKNSKDGAGFTFSPFDVIDENITRINPIFEALFFNTIGSVKKILQYEPLETFGDVKE